MKQQKDLIIVDLLSILAGPLETSKQLRNVSQEYTWEGWEARIVKIAI